MAVTYVDGAVFLLSFDSNRDITAQCLIEPGTGSIGHSKPKWSYDDRLLGLYIDRNILVWDVTFKRKSPLFKILYSSSHLGGRFDVVTQLDEFAWGSSSNKLAVFLAGKNILEVWEAKESSKLSVMEFSCISSLSLSSEASEDRYKVDDEISWASHDTKVIVPCIKNSQIVTFLNNNPVITLINKGARRVIISSDGSQTIFDQAYTLSVGGWGEQLAFSLYVDNTSSRKDGFYIGFPPESSIAKGSDESLFKYWSYSPDSIPPTITWSADGSRIYCSMVTGITDRDANYSRRSSIMVWDGNSGNLLYETTRIYCTYDTIFNRIMPIMIADIAIHPKGYLAAVGENIKLNLFGFIWSFSLVQSQMLPY